MTTRLTTTMIATINQYMVSQGAPEPLTQDYVDADVRSGPSGDGIIRIYSTRMECVESRCAQKFISVSAQDGSWSLEKYFPADDLVFVSRVTRCEVEATKVVIAALAGVKELVAGTELTTAQQAQVQALRTSMGLSN